MDANRKNPKFANIPNLATMNDIKPGVNLRRHHNGSYGNHGYVLTVVSGPEINFTGDHYYISARFRGEASETEYDQSLADMGIIPYFGEAKSSWNDSNYTTVEPSEQGKNEQKKETLKNQIAVLVDKLAALN